MANRTIASLAAQVVYDTSKLLPGTVLTRKELNSVNKLFRETRTPTEQFGAAVDQLGDMLKAKTIDQDLYNRALDKMQRELAETGRDQRQATHAVKEHAEATRLARFWTDGNTQALGDFRSRLAALHPTLLAIAAATIVWSAATRAVRATISTIADQFAQVDELAKHARQLGLALGDLEAIRDVAGEASGVTAQVVDKALQGMVRRVAEAARGTGEAQQAIKDLGLEAKELHSGGTFAAFSAIADAMQGVRSEQDRLLITSKLFGEEGAALVTTLGLGSDALTEAQDQVKRYGLALNEVEVAGIERANDTIGDMKEGLTGVWREVSAKLAPSVILVAEEIRDLVVESSNFRSTFVFAFEVAGPLVAVLIDKLTTMLGKFQLLQAGVVSWVASLAEAVQKADELQAKVRGIEPNPDLQTFAESMRSSSQDLGREALDNIASGLRGDAFARLGEIKAEIATPAPVEQGSAFTGMLERGTKGLLGVIDKGIQLPGQLVRQAQQQIGRAEWATLKGIWKGPQQLDRPEVPAVGANTATLRGSAEAFALEQQQMSGGDGENRISQQQLAAQNRTAVATEMLVNLLAQGKDKLNVVVEEIGF